LQTLFAIRGRHQKNVTLPPDHVSQGFFMTYEEFASELPLHRTMVFESAEKREEALQGYGINHEVRQLGKGKFRSDLAVRGTEQAELFSCRMNKAVSISLKPAVGMVGFLLARSANGQYSASGENVANDKLLVLPNGSGTEIVAPDLAGVDAIFVSESRFIEMTEVLCPTFIRPERMAVIEGNAAQLHALRKAVIRMVCDPDFEPDHGLVSNLFAATIAWMENPSSHAVPEDLLVNGARTRTAKLAQEFIQEHYREAVHIEDLCRVTGIGVRTLQRCFREYFKMTITDYLNTVRLNSAHRELAAAHRSQESVTKIALRHGFTHLGRFSVKFREHFGESPSATLATRDGRKSHSKEISATTFVDAANTFS
jgi:AraC-like DNA-binding protein